MQQIASFLVTIIIGIMTALIAEFIIRIPKFLKKRYLRLLLDFPMTKKLVFVYPPKARHKIFLPRAATEDFMAMNNVISVLLSIGWNSEQFVTRDTDRLTQEQGEQNSVIIFGSSKSNSFARKVHQKLLDNKVRHYYATPIVFKNLQKVQTVSEEQWVMTDGHGFFLSPINEVIQKFREEQEARKELKNQQEQMGKDEPKPIYERSLEDYAAITKVRNPWRRENQIMLIEGIRGVGTWGAAETLRKWYDLIYSQRKGWFGKFRKQGSFSILLKIYYRNSDIVDAEVVNFIDIDD